MGPKKQINQSNDCYFFRVDVSEYNSKNKKVNVYNNFTSIYSLRLTVPNPEFNWHRPGVDKFQCKLY